MQLQAQRTRDPREPASSAPPDGTLIHAVTTRPSPARVLTMLFGGDPVFLVDLSIIAVALCAYFYIANRLDVVATTFTGLLALLILAQRTQLQRLLPSALDDAGDICKRVFMALATTVLLALLVGSEPTRLLVVLSLATTALLLVGRGISYAVIRQARQRTEGTRVLVLGTGAMARRVIAALREHPEYGLSVVGTIADQPTVGIENLGTEVLSSNAGISQSLSEHGIQGMVVSLEEEQPGVLDAIRSAMAIGAAVWIVPKGVEYEISSGKEHIWGIPIVRLRPLATNRPEWFLKRAFDIVIAGLTLVLTAPLQALIAILVYIDSGYPILLRQVRVGQDGRAFTILKFRTMTSCSDAVIEEEWKAGPGRVTRVGRILRESDLDELPQLFNVLKGDMSLVGPRPERPYFVSLFASEYPTYDMRHRLPVGMTGWAQIHGLRGDTSIEQRVAFDNHYIETWSLAQDVRIILRTVMQMAKKATRARAGLRGTLEQG